MKRLFVFSLVFGLLAPPAQAEVTLKKRWPKRIYEFTRDTKFRWRLNDYICFVTLPEAASAPTDAKAPEAVTKKDSTTAASPTPSSAGAKEKASEGEKPKPPRRIACGQVVRLHSTGMVVQINALEQRMKEGQVFQVERLGPSRFYASTIVDDAIAASTEPLDQRVIALGASYLQPFLHFEQGLGKRFAMGFMPIYLSQQTGASKTQGFSHHITANYYSSRLFKGFWSIGGLGVGFLTGEQGTRRERNTTLSLLGGAGWRFLFRNGITVGGALGAQFHVGAKYKVLSSNWGGFLPLLLVQVGYKF